MDRHLRFSLAHRVASVSMIALLTGCTSIPLSAIWKLHDMTAERFFAHDPRALRVAIRTDDTMRRGAGAPQIRIDVDAPRANPLCYAFALDATDFRTSGDAPLDESDPHRRWYAFRLSAQGVAAFERAKREVRAKDLKDADFSLNVTMTDVLVPAQGVATMPIRIDVALDRSDGYFTLINETVVDLAKKAKPAATASAKAPACAPAS